MDSFKLFEPGLAYFSQLASITITTVGDSNKAKGVAFYLAIYDLLKEYPLWKNVIDTKYLDIGVCKEEFAAGGKLSETFDLCIETQDWRPLFHETLGIYQPSRLQQIAPSDPGYVATELAWNSNFVGDNWKLIEERSIELCNRRQDGTYYAPFFTILQSSGMGKSRMVDEYSKHHVMIPLCLREISSTGFPPSDQSAMEYLSEYAYKDRSMERVNAFMFALFSVAKQYLSTIIQDLGKPNSPRPVLASKFHGLMSQQDQRNTFYKQVVKLAHETKNRQKPKSSSFRSLDHARMDSPDQPLRKAAGALVQLIQGFTGDTDGPAVLVCFDEAHALLNHEDPYVWNSFLSVQSALHNIRHETIVSVFISTTRIHSVRFRTKEDSSARMHEGLYRSCQPLCALGYDIHATDLVSKGKHSVGYYAEVRNMIRFGRPLFYQTYKHGTRSIREDIIHFAKQKILCGRLSSDEPPSRSVFLALMAIRLPLEFNTMTPEGKTDAFDQVHKHMRLCLYVHEDFQSLQTLQPTEPILSEAASLIIRDKDVDQAEGLVEVLEGPSIHKGDRGELICMLLWLLARDQVVGENYRRRLVIKLTDLMENLLGEKWNEFVMAAKPSASKAGDEDVSFKDKFKDAGVYLTQFIKVQEPTVLNRARLWVAVARGAAILCDDNAKGINIVIPFVLDPEAPLGPDNISAIIIQVKNDSRYKQECDSMLFDKMDVFDDDHGLFGLDGGEDEEAVYPPVIRMVFALASPASSVSVVPSQHHTSGSGVARPVYVTTYDIWCAGALKETFGVVKSDTTYAKLLKLTQDSFPEPKALSREELYKRNMCPMELSDPAC